MRARTMLLVALLAAAATCASGAISGTVSASYPDIMGCEQACRVAAGGWPFAYAVDYPGISPVGSASMTGAVLGVDKLWAGSLAATFGCWLALFACTAQWLPLKFKQSSRNSTRSSQQ